MKELLTFNDAIAFTKELHTSVDSEEHKQNVLDLYNAWLPYLDGATLSTPLLIVLSILLDEELGGVFKTLSPEELNTIRELPAVPDEAYKLMAFYIHKPRNG